MAKITTSEGTEPASGMRRCIGSKRFGIEAHEAPVEEFPIQPSQKDGRGRMCKVHWNQYTARLARDAKARKAASDGEVAAPQAPPADAAPAEGAGKRQRVASTPQGNRYTETTEALPTAESEGDAG